MANFSVEPKPLAKTEWHISLKGHALLSNSMAVHDTAASAVTLPIFCTRWLAATNLFQDAINHVIVLHVVLTCVSAMDSITGFRKKMLQTRDVREEMGLLN